MPFDKRDLPVIIELLREQATARELDNLFRSKGAPFSSKNRATFVEERLRPAIETDKVSVDDLAALLGEAEEHGRQHVLLYRALRQAASTALEISHVRRGLRSLGVPTILDEPRVLDRPTSPTWTEARLELHPKGQLKALVLKQVCTREHRELIEEKRVGDRLKVEYKFEDTRAVNLVKLHADGFCEVRIASHQRPKYEQEASQLLLELKDVLPVRTLQQVPLTVAKSNLFEQRKNLSAELRYTNSTLRNSMGNTIVAASGTEEGDLFADEGMTSSLDQFVAHEGYCDASNVWFRVGSKPNGEPSWVHVLLSGKDHEFALTAQCSVKEYEYVLERLRAHNR